MLAKQASIADVIHQHVHLGRLSSTGFYAVRCAVCNDHSERAGFKLDGDEVGYSCFNCHTRFRYEEGSGKYSRSMKEVLRAFGVPDEALQEVSATLFFNKADESEKEITIAAMRRVKLTTPEVSFPPATKRIGSDGFEELQIPIVEYLLKRKMDPEKFYFSRDPKHLGRVVIPFWRDGKLIYWQSRAIDDEVRPRYRNCEISMEAVIYGFDRLFEYSDAPLFVTEGVFDAESIDGISLLGSTLNEAKIELLKKTRRRILFVIDMDDNGSDLGKQVLDNGWELTYVDPRAEDINDSVQKFGRLFTIYSLIRNATTQPGKDSHLELGLGLLEAKLRRSKWST